MLPMPRNYVIWPSVVPADQPCEMTILAAERAFFLKEDEDYQLTIIAVDGDEPDYYHPIARKTLTVKAQNGMLRFAFSFAGEQEHLVILTKDEKKLAELSLYSLREDLYSLLPLRGDLHAHSFRSDGRRDPAALAGHFREQGYDFFALTDHNRYFPGGEIDEAYQDVQTGLCRVKGEEVHAPGTVVHIVHVGGSSSVADLYVHDREGYEEAVRQYEQRVPETVPEAYRERYAKIMWATDSIHKAGGLAIFPHPYWRPGASRMHNVCDDFARLLLKSGMFDAYELVGGMGQVGINRSIALWGELRAEGLKLPVVGSSDVHELEKSAHFPHMFTICFARSSENGAIMDAVRSGLSVAVESSGAEYSREYRCYGSLRLVSYAQFLLKHYFPNLQRICQGEGVAMRAYAMGEADQALIELQAQQADSFRQRFLGRLAPVFPAVSLLDFENRWREVQLNGPLTKGGTIDAPPVTRNI